MGGNRSVGPGPDNLGFNEHLIGARNGRERLCTPALLVDLDVFERNLHAMRELGRKSGLKLRPHAKAHKSIEIARQQVAAGAIGLSCATLGEAEILGRAGIPGILITSPLATASLADRLAELHRDIDGLMIVADHADHVAVIDRVAAQAGKKFSVLVDIDVGQHRTGVSAPQDAVALARRIAAASHLRFAGIQAYYGHLQHLDGFAQRRQAVLEQVDRLREFIGALRAAGHAAEIVSGGGTGTALIDAEMGVFTEIQPGSYLFMDADYQRPALWPDGVSPFATSLFVRALAISVNRPELAVVNAGIKSFATDSGVPAVARGASAAARYKFMGDEHGGLVYANPDDARLAVGDAIEFVVSHCDPTVNLFDFYHCMRDDMLADIWRIDARGR